MRAPDHHVGGLSRRQIVLRIGVPVLLLATLAGAFEAFGEIGSARYAAVRMMVLLSPDARAATVNALADGRLSGFEFWSVQRTFESSARDRIRSSVLDADSSAGALESIYEEYPELRGLERLVNAGQSGTLIPNQ